MKTGAIIIAFSILGVIAIKFQLTLLCVIYNIYCIFGTILVIGLGAVTFSNIDRLREKYKKYMR